MKELKFKVTEQKLTKNGDFSNLIAGNDLKLSFEFNNDWNNYKKLVVFEYSKGVSTYVQISNNSAILPQILKNKENFKMYVAGSDGTNTIKTNKILIEQEV